MTMAGYSGTPLPQKLGIKPGLTVVTINTPANYRRLLGAIPEGVTFSDYLSRIRVLFTCSSTSAPNWRSNWRSCVRKSPIPDQFGFPGQKDHPACQLT